MFCLNKVRKPAELWSTPDHSLHSWLGMYTASREIHLLHYSSLKIPFIIKTGWKLIKDVCTVCFDKVLEDFPFKLFDNPLLFIACLHFLRSELINGCLLSLYIDLKLLNCLIKSLLLANELLDASLLFRLLFGLEFFALFLPMFFDFFRIVCASAVGDHFLVFLFLIIESKLFLSS